MKNTKFIKAFFSGHRVIFVVLCLFGLCMMQAARPAKTKKRQPKQQDEKVYLVHSDELYYDMFGPNHDAQIVKGKVHFLHKGGHLYCDSAYFYQQANSVRAMGHVHYVQGDTFSLKCERGFYDGNEMSQIMEARVNVVLKHRKQTLTTDSLNFDRIYDEAYFFDGGKLVDGKDQLVSDWGKYNTATKKAEFRFNVVMLSPGQRVESDTLYYDTNTSYAHVVGPSTIYNDTTVIKTEDGYFDNKNDKSELFSRSTIVNGQQTITGDSLFYDKATGNAFGYGAVVFIDEKNKNELHGDYVEYNENTGYGYATRNALVMDYSQKDTLYMHGDSIKLYTFNIETDSVYRKVHCFNKVRAYRVDLQAVCDSLVGDSRDSCLRMYHDPIIWNNNRQIVGDSVLLFSNDSTIREAHVMGAALSIEKCPQEDGCYNQIESDILDAYMTNGDLRKVVAVGTVTAIFYPVDDKDSTLMMLNYTKTDTMRTYFSEKKKLDHIWTNKHSSDMYPMTQIPADKRKVRRFAWYEEMRPVDKDDIFIWRDKKDAKNTNGDAKALEQGIVSKDPDDEPIVVEEEEEVDNE